MASRGGKRVKVPQWRVAMRRMQIPAALQEHLAPSCELWQAYKKERRQQCTPLSWVRILQKALKNPSIFPESVEWSIEKTWSGVFPRCTWGSKGAAAAKMDRQRAAAAKFMSNGGEVKRIGPDDPSARS